jgi:protein-disulfide isomerase
MRRFLMIGVFTVVVPWLLAAPPGVAANLDTKQIKKTRVVHHKRAKVVLDYDGTAVAVTRTRRYVVKTPDGAEVVVGPFYVHRPVYAEPATYFNGQPLRPQNAVRSSYRYHRYHWTRRSS